MPNTKERKIVPEPSPTGEVLYNPTTGEPISAGVTPTGAVTGGANQPYSVITGEGGTPSPSNPPANNPPPITTPSSGSAGGMSAKSYAQWLYSQSLSLASEQRKQLVDASEITRKRSIADANSSYMKSLATYGQNAEKMASMGLSGSGYGEYLTSQAYAQKRSTVQNANAQHLATEKEAIYQEKVAKQEALSTYHANMLQAQAEQNNAYNSLLSAASSGASIESIMASGQWGLLGADQQTQIKNIAQSNSFKLRIDGGESIEDIMADANYNTLSADAQQSLQNYYQTKQKNDANAAATAYTNFINMLRSGAPLTSIQGMTGYDLMTPDQLAEFARIDAYNRADALLKGGKTLAEIEQQNPDIWSKLGDVEKANLQRTSQDLAAEDFESDTRFNNIVLDAIAGLKNGTYTFDEVKAMPFYQSGSLSEADKTNVQNAANYRALQDMIENGTSIEDIKIDDRYNALSEGDRGELDRMATAKMEEDSASALGTLEKFLTANKNLTLEEIKANHPNEYNKLTESDRAILNAIISGNADAKKEKESNTMKYLKSLIDNGMDYNDVTQEIGYGDLDPALQDALKTYAEEASDRISWGIYTDLWENFESGVSLDVIKGSPYWDKLTPDDRELFETKAGEINEQNEKKEAATSVSTMIENNKSWADIEASNEYALLDEDQKNSMLGKYQKQAKSAYLTLLGYAETGISKSTIETDSMYNLLNESQRRDVQNMIDRYNSNLSSETYDKFVQDVQSGKNLGVIMDDPLYKTLSEEQKKGIQKEFYSEEYKRLAGEILQGSHLDSMSVKRLKYETQIWDEENKNKLFDLLAEELAYKYMTAESAKGLSGVLDMQYYPEDFVDKVVKTWQNNNLQVYLNEKAKEPYAYVSFLDIENEVKNGQLPPNAIKELQAVGMLSKKYSSSEDITNAYKNGKITESEYISSMGNPTLNVEGMVDYNITDLADGDDDAINLYIHNDKKRRLITDTKVTDSGTINALNSLAPHANRQGYKLVIYDGALYLYTDNGWMSIKTYDNSADEAIARILSATSDDKI